MIFDFGFLKVYDFSDGLQLLNFFFGGWGRGGEDLNEIVYKFNSHFVHENRDLNTVLLAMKGKS